MVRSTKESGTQTEMLGMEKACKYGLMVHCMRVIGGMIRPMEEEDSFMRMVIFMKVSGKTIRLMATVNTFILMAQCTRGIGKKTNRMVGEKRHGRMVHATK